MIRAKIVGAGGYGGAVLTGLLLRHPEVDIGCLVSLSGAGLKMSEIFPHLRGFCDEMIVLPEDKKAAENYDVTIFSTPDGVGMQAATVELERGAKVIDCSGDFRFSSTERYAAYARLIGRDPTHAAPALLERAQYGLPELHAFGGDQDIVGNPGCFAVSCILGLAPAVQSGLIDPNSIICDCKTGVSGAGKTPAATFHYPHRHDNMNAYRLNGHQHMVEIEQELELLHGDNIQITFTAQVVPVCRGIMSVCYADLDGTGLSTVIDAFRAFYPENGFVRVQGANKPTGTADVRGTNFCNLTVDVDQRTNRLRVISHIDNLMKGQAGNALQVLNLLFKLEPSAALGTPGQYP